MPRRGAHKLRTDVDRRGARADTHKDGRPWQDLFAGLVGSVLSIAYGLSFAALIFSGPLTPWLAYGIAGLLESLT